MATENKRASQADVPVQTDETQSPAGRRREPMTESRRESNLDEIMRRRNRANELRDKNKARSMRRRG